MKKKIILAIKKKVDDKIYSTVEEMFKDFEKEIEEEPFYVKIKDRIELFFRDVKFFFYKVKKLFRKLYLIWDDDDFDYGYTWDILAKKIKLNRECCLRSKHHSFSRKQIRKNKIAEEAAKRLADEGFNDNYPIIMLDKDFNPPKRFLDNNKTNRKKALKCYGIFTKNLKKYYQDLLFDFMRNEMNRWWI